MNGGSYKKRGLIVWFGCQKDFFLNFLKRIEKHSVIIIPQKLKSLLVKAELSLSFGAFACGYLKRLVRDPHSFK
ncbi:hypothetical protein HMPREF1407_01095 [Helicobacter pylori GAM244Ai]|nr:hypothetical protein HMPREF1407_01095 [Helicobacter pylori GAM244Ai]